MKVFVPLVFCLSLALAEPPVGDGYPSGRSGHDDHDHHDSHAFDFQRSLSQEYGPPAASRSFGSARNSIPQEYGAPSATAGLSQRGPSSRNALSTSYGAPSTRGLDQEYGAPSTRGLDQEYGAPSARSGPSSHSSISQEYGLPSSRSLSQGYSAPSARGLSQEYGVPSARASPISSGRTGLSQEYGPPSLRNSDSYARAPSNQYGAPEFRSIPSEDYLTSQRSFGAPSQKYGAPSQFRSSPSQQYGVPSARNNDISSYSNSFNSFGSRSSAPRTPSQSYGTPSSRSLSTQYGLPAAARGSDSYSQGFASRSLSQSYGAPAASARALSDTYGAPSARGISQEYGTPSRAADLTTNAFASSFGSPRSSPSEKYGAPVPRRDAMLSTEYGVPDQLSSRSSQGLGYARNALDELFNQEPASYDFGYKVSDYISGSDFGHSESRQDNRAEGSYFVVLPDGTKQVVEYEADERGFKPRISVQPAEADAGSGGDAQAGADGPY